MLVKRLIALFAVLAFSTAAFATPVNGIINPNFTGSLTIAEINAQGGLWVGDKLFSGFRVTTVGTGIGPRNESEIGVTGITVQGPNGVEYGIRLNAFWQSYNGNWVDTTIKFQVSISDCCPNLLIHDNSLWMTGVAVRNSGNVSITENVFAQDPDVYPNSESLADKLVYVTKDVEVLYDHAEFVPIRTIWVVKDIGIAGGGATGFATLSELGQSFSQIPEPATMGVLALGGILLAARRRRR